MPVELLIHGGLVIDGAGIPGFYGAVAVEGETLRILHGNVASFEQGFLLPALSNGWYRRAACA